MIIAGIDYSITSPSCSIFTGGNPDIFSDYQVYYLNNNKNDNQVLTKFPNIHGELHKSYEDNIERYENISSFFIEKLIKFKVTKVFIEGYAFMAKGLVFNIAENTGILKYFIRKNNIDLDVFSPATIKKYASGKGNCDKQKMIESFQERTGVYLNYGVFKSPYADIVDSWWCCRLGLEQ